MWINLRFGQPIEQKNTRANIDDIVTTRARKRRKKNVTGKNRFLYT